MTQTEWPYPSSSSDKTYTVRLLDNRTLVCDCRGWLIKRPNKPRECRHIVDVVKTNGWTRVVVADEFIGVESLDATVTPVATPVVQTPTFTITPTEPVSMAAPFPMLATAMTGDSPTGAAFEAAYGGGEWFLDEKIDGYRCVIVKRGDSIQGWSRPRAGGNGALPTVVPTHIAEQVRRMPDCVLDGELYVPGGNSWDVTSARASNPGALVFIAFDVLECLGNDTKGMTQDNRREVLTALIAHTEGQAVQLVNSMPVSWAAVDAIWARGGEGCIVKHRAGTYRPGYRSPSWIKVVQARTVTMTVTGFVAGKLGPYSTLALSGPVDIKTVKTLNNEWLNDIAANPASFIGRRIVIGYTPRGDKAMHPRIDHMAGEGE